jgi:hypothetical protein
VSVALECEGGYVVIPNYESAVACDWQDKEIKKWEGTTNHWENFINTVRSQKRSDLNAEILEGHLSAALCHTGNISYELGKQRTPEEIQDAVKNNKDVADALGRMEEHLKANMVDLHKTPATLGMSLIMNPKTERFIGSAKADKMLARDYRAPFVVPEKV